MSKDIQVKNFKITFIKKPVKNNKRFEVELRALNKEDAIEKAYAILDSKHRLRRLQLEVENVKELTEQQLRSPILRELALNDNVKIPHKTQ